MQPTTPQRPVMDVTVRSRTAPAVPPATPPVSQSQPAEAKALAAAEAPAPPEPSASIDVHEAPQYEDESEKPALQTADQPRDASATRPPQSEKPVEDPTRAQTEVRQQPPPKSTSTLPIGAIIATLFVMAVLAGIAVMVYLQS